MVLFGIAGTPRLVICYGKKQYAPRHSLEEYNIRILIYQVPVFNSLGRPFQNGADRCLLCGLVSGYDTKPRRATTRNSTGSQLSHVSESFPISSYLISFK